MIFSHTPTVPTHSGFQSHRGLFCRNVPLLNSFPWMRYQEGGR